MLCFRKFLVAKKFMDRREGEVSIFSFESFLSHRPKKFVGEPFCVSEDLGYRRMLGIKEGTGITIFCQNCFVSQYRNIP